MTPGTAALLRNLPAQNRSSVHIPVRQCRVTTFSSERPSAAVRVVGAPADPSRGVRQEGVGASQLNRESVIGLGVHLLSEGCSSAERLRDGLPILPGTGRRSTTSATVLPQAVHALARRNGPHAPPKLLARLQNWGPPPRFCRFVRDLS